MTNSRPVTPELINELTDEIYSFLETDNNGINININLSNEVKNSSTQATSAKKQVENRSNQVENRVESRKEDRQFRNRGLQDLIRILLIRELLRKTWWK